MDKNQTDILYFLIITTSLLVFFSVLVINLLLVSRNRKLRHINEMHRLQVLQEKELANVRLEVTETTLREVAADLHDDTGQLLTVAIMQLNRLSKNAPDDTVEQALHAVRSGLDSVRNISRILNSDYLRSFGLKTALQRLKERLEKGGKLHLRYDLDDDLVWSDPSLELHAFRIIQELVSNTIKHAEATEINIQLNMKEDKISMYYTDNGKGLPDDPGRPAAPGAGLLNIEQRVKYMGGQIIPLQEAHRGFHLKFLFPTGLNKKEST